MDLTAIAAVTDQKQKAELYKQALDACITTADPAQCKAFVEHMLLSEVPLVISRQVLHSFVLACARLPAECRKEVAQHALTAIQQREVSFDEQLMLLREAVAQMHEDDEEWSQCAQVLAGVDLERSARNVEPNVKLARYLKISRLYLEDDDAVSAEQFFIKASPLVSNCEDSVLNLQYKATYARISDSKRRFMEAASRYYELSQLPPSTAGSTAEAAASYDEDVTALLAAAVTCSILAPAGTHRRRLLAMLYKDERIADAGRVPQFPFLEKMFMERLITPEEVTAFDLLLKPHQKALLPDGFTVLQQAVIQHNLLSLSQMYANITFDELATVLGMTADKAEVLASGMISENRLNGHIDQVDNVIYFDDDMDQLMKWDQHIMSACESVNAIVDYISVEN